MAGGNQVAIACRGTFDRKVGWEHQSDAITSSLPGHRRGLISYRDSKLSMCEYAAGLLSIHRLDISAPGSATAVISDGVCPRRKMPSRCRPVQSQDWFRVRFPEGTESFEHMMLVGATDRVSLPLELTKPDAQWYLP